MGMILLYLRRQRHRVIAHGLRSLYGQVYVLLDCVVTIFIQH